LRGSQDTLFQLGPRGRRRGGRGEGGPQVAGLRQLAAADFTSLAEVPFEFAEVLAIQRTDDVQSVSFGCKAAFAHENESRTSIRNRSEIGRKQSSIARMHKNQEKGQKHMGRAKRWRADPPPTEPARRFPRDGKQKNQALIHLRYEIGILIGCTLMKCFCKIFAAIPP
jgi:hypothetical protein